MKPSIRDALPSDATGIAQLVTDLGYPVDAGEMASRLKNLPAQTYRTLVACDESSLLGFIGLITLPVYEHPEPIGWILALCVSPDHRRKGIARALVAAAEDHFRHQGAGDMRLHSGLQRDDAHAFYEKIGFDKSGYRFRKRLS